MNFFINFGILGIALIILGNQRAEKVTKHKDLTVLRY